MAAGFTITYKGSRFTVDERPELSIDGRTPQCIRVAGAWYRVGFDPTDADVDARRFILDRIRSTTTPRVPALLASPRFPMLFAIHRRAIAAWPQFVARGKGAKTFRHPTLGRVVATEKRDPHWLFETAGRAPSACGSASAEQSIADVIDLAKMWLRSE